MIVTDLRSDTVTRPTPKMLQAMFAAPVGDDVFGEDPTVNALEEKAAALFGLEAGLFCPSGTMTNQIAIKAHTEPLSEVICDYTSHIYQYEGGGIAANSGASVYLLHGERGKITPDLIRTGIRPNNIHYPLSKLVALENTSNKGGGSYYTLPEIMAISEVCRQNHLVLHLDGARVFNALVAAQESPLPYGEYFDSISVCLSKGLGTPVGSVLLGSKSFIHKSRRIRKVFGGGMRQAGYLAAAGIYALDNHINRLAEDHAKARILADVLQECSFVQTLQPVDTNIVIFRLVDGVSEEQFLRELAAQHILALDFGPQTIRLVTHLDFTSAMLDHTVQVLKNLKF
ncbi:aminotransferase class I/II-fold pyridoxal phosphate-dependent enzyme [Adhaeribacter swui]|uniref:Aminotransferase class I/II-fold pyridoxal phosphate-dependent enzyme n=1 Tax=Adhaeribacter swui TaxID=2086471 RepID=A0A7G7GBL2_9BACT|nr:GntG family PLP-dependent aldolase [Adhaeribacter swui]QNF34546.1 aminotransferase class I/II-fold pyridoxal phosphate-dependent enzyme [Adhaeribacter swui]